MELSRLKGTYDIAPKEADFFNWIETTVQGVFTRFGYKKVVFPVIEYATLFARGAGESSDIVVKKEMYQFEDQGHRMIALRPEGTASAVRLYLENGLSMQGYSARLFYTGPMFRAEKPQAGRYRQFVQFGAEMIGDPNPYADVELLMLNNTLFSELGLKNYTLYINSIGCKECRPKYTEALKAYFQPKLSDMCPDCRARFDTNVLRILDCKENQCRAIIEGAPTGLESLCEPCSDHFHQVQEGLKSAGISYSIDPRLVRGLDYYNRTVFEFKSGALGSQSTFSAGGRYDYLVKEFGGMETPAAGFAMGMERLAMVIEAENGKKREEYNRAPEVYIAFIGGEHRAFALSALEKIRKAGLTAVTEFRYDSLKKHLKSADAMKAKHCLFIGGDEIAKGVFTLRNLADGSQKEGPLEELIEGLK